MLEPIGQTTQDTSALTGATDANLNRDDFLQLLVTQLSNQDPLNPMDGQEFAAQLAQFSSLEQLIDINDVLGANNQLNGLLAQSINSGVAADLIGKTIEAEGDQFAYNGSDDASLHFELFQDASDIEVDIFNAAGTKVRSLSLSQLSSGDHTINWDGKDDEGNDLASGSYTFSLSATDASGNAIQSRTFTSGLVDRVTYGQDGIFLWIGGNTSISMGNVTSVRESE